jgi:hypothetical protein
LYYCYIFIQYLESKSHQLAARQKEAVQKQGPNLYHPRQVVSEPHQWKWGYATGRRGWQLNRIGYSRCILPLKKERQFGRTSEMMEGSCFVISVTCLRMANTGHDDDDDDDYCYLNWYLSTRLHGVISQKAVALIPHREPLTSPFLSHTHISKSEEYCLPRCDTT